MDLPGYLRFVCQRLQIRMVSIGNKSIPKMEMQTEMEIGLLKWLLGCYNPVIFSLQLPKNLYYYFHSSLTSPRAPCFPNKLHLLDNYLGAFYECMSWFRFRNKNWKTALGTLGYGDRKLGPTAVVVQFKDCSIIGKGLWWGENQKQTVSMDRILPVRWEQGLLP